MARLMPWLPEMVKARIDVEVRGIGEVDLARRDHHHRRRPAQRDQGLRGRVVAVQQVAAQRVPRVGQHVEVEHGLVAQLEHAGRPTPGRARR